MPKVLTPTDIPKLAQLQPEDWASITPSFELYLGQDFAHPHKIERNGAMVAIGNLTRFTTSGWLSQIITHREHRGYGHGSTMVSHLLDHASEHGVQTVSLIATPQGRPLYKKFNFREELEYVFFQTPAKPNPAAWDRKALRQARPADFPAILNLDLTASGEERSRILEPHLASSWVFGEPGSVQGFWMPGLREGLVVARNQEAGCTLLAAKAQTGSRMVLPAVNTEALSCVKGLGYQEISRSWRMVRGPELKWNPSMLWSRIAGKLG